MELLSRTSGPHSPGPVSALVLTSFCTGVSIAKMSAALRCNTNQAEAIIASRLFRLSWVFVVISCAS
eukprot:2991123-Pleurochrysis_carterae.AAC.1